MASEDVEYNSWVLHYFMVNNTIVVFSSLAAIGSYWVEKKPVKIL